ncbi:DUF1189 domain-containing protein [Clostridium sp. CTA-5]
MKGKTKFLEKFINSIYNIKEFSKYVTEGLGKAILYVFLMSLIFGTLKGISIGYEINKQANGINEKLQDEENGFIIENGILNTKNSPLKFEENSSLIYIDSSIELDKSSELRNLTVNNDINVLFLKDGVSLKTPFENKVVYYKEAFGNDKIDNNEIISQMSIITKVLIGISFIYAIGMCFINVLINCIFVTIFAGLALIFMKLTIKYKVLYSLSLYACTLPLIFKTILEIIFPNIYLDTMFIVGTLVYVIFILRYIKFEIISKIKSSK